MRDADETIERLMAGLRDAEPAPGMKRRILEAMEAHQATASDSHWRRVITPWPLRPSVAASLVCAAALAASLIVATRVNQPSHMPASAPRHSTHADVGQHAQPEAVAHKAPTAPQRTASRVSARRPHDSSAVNDVQSASYPAPPLPLTEQERMLLRVAHRDDAKNKALLNPELQAAQSAKNTEQFQRFFEIDAKEMRSESE
jgi:hypothetical protein